MQFQKDKYKKKDRPRKVYIQDNTPDSEYGENLYTDPNGNQILSPMVDSQEQMMDSNEQSGDPQKAKSIFQTIRNDLKNNSDMVQLVSDQPLPSLVVNIPSRNGEDVYERSPQPINVGSSRDDYDYNERPINARKSPKDMNYPNFRDSNDDYIEQSPYDDEDYQGYQENPRNAILSRSRSPQAAQGYRNKNLSPYGHPGAGGVVPFNKMSPSQNYDELNYSGDKNPEQYNNLKNYLGNNRGPKQNAPSQTMKNTTVINLPKDRDDRDDVGNKYNNRTYNNMSYRDVKRIANRFTKVYDPNRNSNGLLVEESQITVPGASDEVFNNRYRVLAKMNRLSNILLAKQRKRPTPNKERTFNARTYNRENSYNGNTRKTFNRHTLAKSPEERVSRRAFSRSPDHKFLYVSLAMISRKGHSCEDRPILRRMRLEKGGVVDLAQEDRKKNKFKIKKAERKKGTRRSYFTNPKYRDKAAKIIQAWWRDLKNIYNDRLNKIIKIQSVFRGKFVRKYMYDLFYLNFLYISFCKKIESVLGNHVRPYVWDKLFGKKKPPEERPKRDKLLRDIISRDYRNDLDTIYPAWRKWISNARKLGVQNSKGRNLVQIRADKEKKLGDVRNCFNKWVYVKKMLDAQDKLAKERNKKPDTKPTDLKKLKGLFRLTNGIDKYAKKEAMNETLPKLEDYLRKNRGKGQLKKIVTRKPKYDKNLLRKYLYKWYSKAMKMKSKDKKDDRLKEIRRKVFSKLVKTIKNRQNKNLLRKYFFKWLKKAIKMALKDERDKLRNLDKTYRTKEVTTIEEYEKKIITYETQKKNDAEVIRKIKSSLNRLEKEIKDKDEELRRKLLLSKDSKDQHLLNYLQGTKILQRAVWRITHRDPLNAMGENIDVDNLMTKLKRMVKIRKLTDKELLRKYFNIWKLNALKGTNPELIYKLLAKFMEITSNNYKRKLLAKKFNKWRRAAGINPYDSLKKAKDIYDLADLIKKINVLKNGDEFLDKLDKTRNPNRFKVRLYRLYKKRERKDRDLLRKYLNKWRNNVKIESVKILKSRVVYTIYDKNTSGLAKKLLNKYFQRWKNKTFKDNLNRYKKDLLEFNTRTEETKRLFIKSIFNGLDNRTNRDLLREYFNRWKKAVDLEKNKYYGINQKRIILSKLVDKRTNIDYINLLHYLLRWKNKMLEMRAADAHKPYRKQVVKILLTKNDKEELQRCFTKWKYGGLKRLPIMPYIVAKRFLKKVLCRKAYREFVKKMTERNPKVLKMKGKELIRTLEDIEDNRLRKFLFKLIQFIQLKYLGRIQPKVHETIKEYYLRKYMERWYENTIADAQRKRELVANWLKDKFTKEKITKETRIKVIITDFINYKDKSKLLNLAYGLYKWRKNAKLDQQIEYAKIIQEFCRTVLDKVIRNKLDRQQQLIDLMTRLYRRKFFKQLTDLARKASTIMREDYRRITKIERLRNMIYEIDIKKILRKYFNIWRNNSKGTLEEITIVIQKKIRQLLARKKVNQLKRLNEILLKLILHSKDKELELLGSVLHKWRKNARGVECVDNSRIIQNFCRVTINNYMRNKFRNYLENLAKKYTRYLILNAAKIDRLVKVLKRRPFNGFIDSFSRRAFVEIIKEVVIRVITKNDDRLRKTLLRYYLEKWIKKVNDINDKEYDAIIKIQSMYRGHEYRKHFNFEETVTRILITIIDKKMKNSEPKNYLRSALAKWRKNVALIACEENAKIIQKFCRTIHDKIISQRVRQNIENYRYLAKILNKLKVSPIEFIERLKENRRMQMLEELVYKLSNKRLDILKDVFDRIYGYPRYKYLLRILPLTDEVRERILRKYLLIWRNKAMRKKGIMEILRLLFINCDNYKTNLLRHYLIKWLYKARYITQKEYAKVICRFCRPILLYKTAANNWHRLADALRNLDKNEDIDEIYYKLRHLLGLRILKKTFVKNAGRKVFDLLNKNRYIDMFKIKITKYFERTDINWREFLLRDYFNRWRNNVRKMRDREDALIDMMIVIDKNNLKNDTNTLADVFILKKFLHDYPLIRALGFLRKLREFAKQKGKNDDLANDLIQARNDLEPQKRNNLIKKLYKVYAYKVLNKLFDNLEKLQEDNATPLKQEFLDKLYMNLMKKAERIYSDKKESETIPKNKKTSFRLKKPTLVKGDQKKKLIYVSLLPSLFRYINEKMLRQKQEGFDAIRKKYNSNKFCDLYKRWAEKQELKPKKELVDKLRRIYWRAASEGPLLLKLFKILRRTAIKRILRKSGKIRKVMGMIYVTRLLVMERNLARERFLRQLIRRWRYIAFSKKLAMNKMKTIYKNLHMTYLEMANCLFGDEGQEEASVTKEFERFATSVGMWENEKPNEKGEEKYVKTMKTQYVFDPVDFEKFQSKYYPTENEEEEYYEEEKKEIETKIYKKYEIPKKK